MNTKAIAKRLVNRRVAALRATLEELPNAIASSDDVWHPVDIEMALEAWEARQRGEDYPGWNLDEIDIAYLKSNGLIPSDAVDRETASPTGMCPHCGCHSDAHLSADDDLDADLSAEQPSAASLGNRFSTAAGAAPRACQSRRAAPDESAAQDAAAGQRRTRRGKRGGHRGGQRARHEST